MDVAIRRAEERDIPGVMELLRQADLVHHNGRPDLFKLTTKYTEEEFHGILADERKPVFVCEDEEGRIVGHGFCVLQRPDNTRLIHDNLTLYIDDICIDESVRGQHIGSALYEHILAYARECGCYNITLNVWSCNPGAMKFYEKIGLVPYKVGMEMIL